MGPSSWRAGGEHCFIAGLNSAADSDSTPASIVFDSGRTEISEKPQRQFFQIKSTRLVPHKFSYFAIMALYQREPYTTADRQKLVDNESDQEEDALVEDYREQVHFDDSMGMDELDRTASFGPSGGPQDMQAQLAAAATPLEYGAALDTKFASYDSYCNLFHYILNSEGPVELEVPTVSISNPPVPINQTIKINNDFFSTTGPGM